jgi:SnoaL-like domain
MTLLGLRGCLVDFAEAPGRIRGEVVAKSWRRGRGMSLASSVAIRYAIPMRLLLSTPLLLGLALSACAPTPKAPSPLDLGALGAVIDDFHDAAAHADEARYFAHFAENGVFLGTDATERWDVAAFRAYAHPHFAKGKAWSFRSIRRAITVAASGDVAWFDEDLATPNLGPARGSGVLVKRGAAWKIAQYNLAITVPNERFDAVKRAAAGEAAP